MLPPVWDGDHRCRHSDKQAHYYFIDSMTQDSSRALHQTEGYSRPASAMGDVFFPKFHEDIPSQQQRTASCCMAPTPTHQIKLLPNKIMNTYSHTTAHDHSIGFLTIVQ